jgi:hypothetical protein
MWIRTSGLIHNFAFVQRGVVNYSGVALTINRAPILETIYLLTLHFCAR